MKKWLRYLALPAAVVVLTACNSTGDSTGDTTNESDLTLEEVFEQAMARQAEIKSTTAQITADQNVTLGTGDDRLEMLSTTMLKVDTHMEPLAIYGEGTVTMNTTGEDLEMPLKMYMTEADGLFVYEESADTWTKLPAEMTDAMLAQMGTQGDATQQLEQLKTYISDFTFEQSDTDYLLTLQADDEKFSELILESAGSALGEMTEGERLQLENMRFEDAVYKLIIDKETFDTKQVDVSFMMEMDMDGQQAVIDLTSSSTFSNFNEVEPITIPQEVLDEAIEAQNPMPQ